MRKAVRRSVSALRKPPDKADPHFCPTLREGEWRAHCVVAAALIGIRQRRLRRFALDPAIRLRTPALA
jgi:hypothetical protein